jgi:hypothetical protein
MPEPENYPVDDRPSDFQPFSEELPVLDDKSEKKNPSEDEDQDEPEAEDNYPEIIRTQVEDAGDDDLEDPEEADEDDVLEDEEDD